MKRFFLIATLLGAMTFVTGSEAPAQIGSSSSGSIPVVQVQHRSYYARPYVRRYDRWDNDRGYRYQTYRYPGYYYYSDRYEPYPYYSYRYPSGYYYRTPYFSDRGIYLRGPRGSFGIRF